MSEVKLVIRDANEDRSGTVHGSVADWFVAALSADPVSIAELDAAVDRFALESPVRGHLAHFSHCLDTEPWDAGLVVIDLAARLVVIDSSYSSPGPKGVIQRHRVQGVGDASVSLRYRLADAWLFLDAPVDWERTACIRRQQRADQPLVDLREIFYGEPMLRFVIDGCRKQFAHRDEIARRVHLEWIESRRRWNARYAKEAQPDPESLTMHELCRVEDPREDIERDIYYGTIRDIHADWLMTPCAELNNEIPRKVLLRDHDRLEGDMSDREYQWTVLERCPPGISPESHAFQFSGFNTSEIVMYYDYVREVAWSCWDRLRTLPADELAALETSQIKLDEFILDEVTRLRAVGEAWLGAPWDEDPHQTPRGIINLERRRLPNGGRFNPIDPDCPCCQALAEMPGIGFWHMDGCNMDGLFAFAYHYDTIEEWEKNQEEYRQMSEQMDREWKLAKEWNLPPKYSVPTAEFGNVWRLVVKETEGDIPLGERLSRIGHESVSVIVKLRIAAERVAGLAVEQHIESLQDLFIELRRACEKSNAEELSPDVELSVQRFMDWVNALSDDVKGYAGCDCEGDDDNDADAYLVCATGEPQTADVSETGGGQQSPHRIYWSKVLRDVQELQRASRFFTKVKEQTPFGVWDADEYPF